MQTKNYKSTKFNIFKNIQISNPSCYNNFSFSFIVFPIACYLSLIHISEPTRPY